MRGARSKKDIIPKESKNPTESTLISETEKWLRKIQDIEKPAVNTKHEREAWDNVQAYIEDAEFFRKKQDWVRAFEACIWAWAFYEAVFKFGKE